MAYTNITADGTTTISDLRPGGQYVWHIGGTFGGGTATLSWYDGTNTIAFSGAALTTGGAVTFYSPTSTVMVVLVGATNPDIIFGITPVTMRN